MSPEEDTLAKLTAAWDVRGIDVATVAFESGTAVSRRRIGSERPWVDTLPALLSAGPEGAEPQFRLGPILGEGGMGIVRTAEQVALGRQVAIKTTREGVDVNEAVPQLLREARITGVLEHPNVVPVYAFGRDEADRPLLVMRRVAGESWAESLRSTDRESDDQLQRHLGILKQVSLAIHFAHDKGIVHRDLKPDNVMVGSYGEVYVLDWGIAVSLRGDMRGVPQAREVAAIEGTPAYMAPEMAAGDGDVIDQRTDVYLLGAVLHEIVTGQPPHDGRDLVSMLTHAFASEPFAYGPEVPRGLAEICWRAMSRHPADRYESAAAFASAIDAFLVHRSSTQLSDEAEARLASLRELLASWSGDEGGDALPIHTTFRECRFAFTQALRSWPENQPARAGLQRALELMVTFELSRNAPDAAANLLAELPDPVDDLRRRVERALARWRDAQARLEALERDQDLTISEQLRRVITFGLALSWLTLWVAAGVLMRHGVYAWGHTDFAGLNAFFCLAIAASAFVGRSHLFYNAANRRLTASAFVVFLGHTLMWLLCGHIGVSLAGTAAIHCLLSFFLWVAGVINVERKWFPIALSSLAGLLFVLPLPEYAFEIVGVSGGLGSLTAAFLARRDRTVPAASQAGGPA